MATKRHRVGKGRIHVLGLAFLRAHQGHTIPFDALSPKNQRLLLRIEKQGLVERTTHYGKRHLMIYVVSKRGRAAAWGPYGMGIG